MMNLFKLCICSLSWTPSEAIRLYSGYQTGTCHQTTIPTRVLSKHENFTSHQNTISAIVLSKHRELHVTKHYIRNSTIKIRELQATKTIYTQERYQNIRAECSNQSYFVFTVTIIDLKRQKDSVNAELAGTATIMPVRSSGLIGRCYGKRMVYWRHVVESQRNGPRKMWQSIDKLMDRGHVQAD